MFIDVKIVKQGLHLNSVLVLIQFEELVSLQFQREGLTKAEIIRKLDTCSLQQETTVKHKRWLVVGEKGGVQLVGCSSTSKTFIKYRGDFLVSHGHDMVEERP